MFKFMKRNGNFRDDAGSDIIANEGSANVNISDSAPILHNSRNFDLNSNANFHDLRQQTSDGDVDLVKRSLRTMPGVFCPVALSMCSVALFMRIGFIVGNTGFYESIGLYGLVFAIYVLTGLSVCAISTNGAIQGGGVYYMISRALGPEFGGSIGALFFVANAIGSAFNGAGLVEALLGSVGETKLAGGLPESRMYKFMYGSVLNTVTLFICLLGANLFSYAVSFIYLVMVVVYVTVLLSIFIRSPMDIPLPGIGPNATGRFTGLSSLTFQNNLYSNYTVDYTNQHPTSFAYTFGVLFSSLTGIMAGANMSGELKKPSRSIPLGTMSAVLFVFLCYFIENVLLAASCEHDLLVNNNQVLQYIVFWGPMVNIGIIATTFSGELSALIGSSRVLKALADDEIFGPVLNFVRYGKTRSGNPWMAVIISFIVAEIVLLVGSLNAIAPLVTIFYLLAYFGINLACLALDLASAPNFRPTFKYFSSFTALVGMIASISMTFIVSIEYASVAIGLLIALITILYFRDFPPEWGSISQALIFHQVRKYLLMLDTRKDHVKFWRPQILLLIANPRSCLPLIEFGNDVKKGGLFVLGNVRVGKLDNYDDDPCAKELPIWMNLVDNLKVKAFVELTLSQSIKDGIQNLVRISGLGGMKPNTIMMGFYDQAVPEDLLKSRFFPKRKRLLNYGLTSTTVSNGQLSAASNVVLHGLQFEELRGATTSNAANGGHLISSDSVSATGETGDSRLSMDEYVDTVRDVLKMKKNLCVCRSFNMLKKDVLAAKNTPIYIDVWPLNFLIPEFCSQLDSTSLFMLQLACILNMVSVWKRAHMRVFLCTDNSDPIENERRKTRLDDLLTQLRIGATTVMVPLESARNVLNRPWISESDLPFYQSTVSNADIMCVSDIYLRACNQLIRQYSTSASLCFLYMPPPPALNQQHQQQPNATNFSSQPLVSIDLMLTASANQPGQHQRETSLSSSPASFLNSGSQLNNNNNNYSSASLNNATTLIQQEQTNTGTLSNSLEPNKRYLRILDMLSDQLPPCVFVNGVSCVTSTHL